MPEIESQIPETGTALVRTAQTPETPTEVATILSEKFPDFSESVRVLAWSPDILWESAKSEDFQPNGKINFLHLSDDGTFTLTVIKPGTKYETTAQVDAWDVSDIREKFEMGLIKWDISRSWILECSDRWSTW